jgi:hypothetical protein
MCVASCFATAVFVFSFEQCKPRLSSGPSSGWTSDPSAGPLKWPCASPASGVSALPVLKGSAQGLSGLFQVHRFRLHCLGWLDHDKE